MSSKLDGEVAQPNEEAISSADRDAEYPTPAPFDPKASASAIIDEARSIQELLKTYESNTRQLKEDVQEFVIREVAEESKFRTISVAVAQEELSALQNTDFIKFSRDYKASDVRADEVMPTSRMHHARPALADGAVHPSAEVAWHKCGHAWAPDKAVALKAYGDVREVLLGWRGRNESSDAFFSTLCADVFEAADTRLCCFFNGHLYSPSLLGMPEYASASNNVVQREFWNALALCQTGTGSHEVIDAAVRSYTAFTLAASSQTAHQLRQHLWEGIRPVQDAVAPMTVGRMNNFAPQVVGDTHDCLTAVQPSRLQNTQTLRGFFMRGRLVAVEHTGPQVDVLRLLCSVPGLNSADAIPQDFAEREMRRLVVTFRRLFSAFCETDETYERSAVMTLAVTPEPLRADNEVAPHSTGVVLSIRPIVPALPFHWQLTWADVCSMGQVLAGHCKEPAAVAASREDDLSGVAFKCTRLAVAALTPDDAISCVYFPVLNAQITRALSGEGSPLSSSTTEASPSPAAPRAWPEQRKAAHLHEDPNAAAATARTAAAVGIVSALAAATAVALLHRK